MNIFTRDLIRRIVASVLLPLFLFHFLPYVTCQQESESADRSRKTNFSKELIIAIILLVTFISLSTVACCLHKKFYSAEIEAAGHELFHSRPRRGLEKEVIIKSFPSFFYSEVKGLKIGKGGVECAICLSEFEDQETLCWMPPCSHTFHANYIDVWLSSRSSCPVCRENLVPYPSIDVEMGNAQRGVQEHPEERRFTGNSLAWNNYANYGITRSRSTGLPSSWQIPEKFFSRSHSTGHSLVQLGENLDRFTLQLPEEVHRKLVSLNLIRISHMALPQAMSSRQGDRSGSDNSGSSLFLFSSLGTKAPKAFGLHITGMISSERLLKIQTTTSVRGRSNASCQRRYNFVFLDKPSEAITYV